MGSKEFDKLIVGFKYVPEYGVDEDSEDNESAEVLMLFDDDTSSRLYMYGDSFLCESFQCDERDLYSGVHSKKFLRLMYDAGRYAEVFEFLFGMHINLFVKSHSLEIREDNPMLIRRELYEQVVSDDALMRNACETYFSYLEDIFNHSKSNISIAARCNQVISFFSERPVSLKDSYSELCSIDLNKVFSKDLGLWGELPKLNSFDSISVVKIDDYYALKLHSDFVDTYGQKFRFTIDDMDDLEHNIRWYCICILFNLIRKTTFVSSKLNVEGLLYSRDVVNKHKAKDNVRLASIMSNAHKSVFEYEVSLVDIIAETILQDMDNDFDKQNICGDSSFMKSTSFFTK